MGLKPCQRGKLFEQKSFKLRVIYHIYPSSSFTANYGPDNLLWLTFLYEWYRSKMKSLASDEKVRDGAGVRKEN